MAKVIHAKRTTAWTVQASTQTKIPSNLRLCASREMIGTEKGGAERLLQTAQAQQTQQKKKKDYHDSRGSFSLMCDLPCGPPCVSTKGGPANRQAMPSLLFV